jgi:hypothetical protein
MTVHSILGELSITAPTWAVLSPGIPTTINFNVPAMVLATTQRVGLYAARHLCPSNSSALLLQKRGFGFLLGKKLTLEREKNPGGFRRESRE